MHARVYRFVCLHMCLYPVSFVSRHIETWIAKQVYFLPLTITLLSAFS